MKKLPLPDIDDAATWRSLAENSRVADHIKLKTATPNVVGRYASYHNARGNLTGFNKVPWAAALELRLAALYNDPPKALAHLSALRKRGSAAVCPMCGSSHTWSLDHMLPKANFPEFYIFSRNLVPACPCNSLRNEDYRGPLSGQRILHPYYDDILKTRLVRARFAPPFPNPKISVKICVNTGRFAPAVHFHVQHTLARTNVLDYWTELWVRLLRCPREMLGIRERRLNGAKIRQAIQMTRDAADAECDTPNNWRSMFYSGLLRSDLARRFLLRHINGVIDGSVDPEDF